MKDFFQILGILILFISSFLYTENAITVVRNFDDLMIEIKEEKAKYEIKPTNALIINDEIVPGLNGKKVNETKSYRNMKRIGEFNPNLFEYDIVKPNISLEKNYQKYIVSGNSNKKQVSLIFLVKDDVDIQSVLDILKQKEIKGTFFIDGYWFEQNNKQVNDIVNQNHIIGNLGYDFKYVNTNFTWMNTIIRQLSNQKNNYCYQEIKNKKDLERCTIYKNYTIKPSLIVKNNPLKEVKNNLKNGTIISFYLDDNLLDELGIIINYIKVKGYDIVTLDKLLSEDI